VGPQDRWLLSTGSLAEVGPQDRWLLSAGSLAEVGPQDRWLLSAGSLAEVVPQDRWLPAGSLAVCVRDRARFLARSLLRSEGVLCRLRKDSIIPQKMSDAHLPFLIL